MRKNLFHTDISDVPGVAIAPPVRCYYRGIHLSSPICGELAAYVRAGRDWFSIEYFCELHRGPADLPIAPEHVFRRIRFSLDVLISAAHTNAPMAHTEALARLQRAIESAGGVLDVNNVGSTVVRSIAPAPARATNGEPGIPE